MVTPAMQLAHKIPDINVQLWATALLRDLYQTCGDGQRAQVCPVFRSCLILVCGKCNQVSDGVVLTSILPSVRPTFSYNR